MSLSNPSHVQGSSDFILAAERITLTIDFGNGTIREYNDLSGSTVLEVTSSVLNVDVQWFGTLAYIREIEGLVGEGEYGWQFWVNGEFASVAANQYILDDNDIVSWVYSTPTQQRQDDPSLVPGILLVSAAGFGFIAIVYMQTSRRIHSNE
ncbi:MAG: DUF4430 domain-containing protein [Candidatus Thorarchaeota archaeon]|nr:DUF4430 domain-containing protein [Candidatus Thorarchaeota archaeon]